MRKLAIGNLCLLAVLCSAGTVSAGCVSGDELRPIVRRGADGCPDTRWTANITCNSYEECTDYLAEMETSEPIAGNIIKMAELCAQHCPLFNDLTGNPCVVESSNEMRLACEPYEVVDKSGETSEAAAGYNRVDVCNCSGSVNVRSNGISERPS